MVGKLEQLFFFVPVVFGQELYKLLGNFRMAAQQRFQMFFRDQTNRAVF